MLLHACTGNGTALKMDLCCRSEMWSTVSEEDRDQCLKTRNDGEFW